MRLKRSATAGDLGDAFRLLSPWLVRRLRARGTGEADVEDIVQESFVRLGRYPPEDRVRHPKALLLRIAGNLAVDAARRRSARGGDRFERIADHDAIDEGQPDPAFMLDLKRAILELPPAIRETFLLARFTPMTNAQIAKRQGISTKTVEWRISRAVSICLARLDR
jgi:RNA polymerase sigma-70 factor (ECF subfamily)